jgi:hypothetical protein
VREAGELAVSKSLSKAYEKASYSWGHDSRRGSAFLDLALKASADFRAKSDHYASRHFADKNDNAGKKLCKAVRLGQVATKDLIR